MKKRSPFAVLPLCMATLACQPAIAVGWNEFLLVSLLLGPVVYRFLRRAEQLPTLRKKK